MLVGKLVGRYIIKEGLLIILKVKDRYLYLSKFKITDSMNIHNFLLISCSNKTPEEEATSYLKLIHFSGTRTGDEDLRTYIYVIS